MEHDGEEFGDLNVNNGHDAGGKGSKKDKGGKIGR
jgi:hypothetical protein